MAPEIDPTGSPGRWTQPANMDMVSGMTQTPPSNIPTFDGEEILAGIRRWVEIETPSHDGVAVNRLVDVVESDLARIGARTIRTPGRARTPSPAAAAPCARRCRGRAGGRCGCRAWRQ